MTTIVTRAGKGSPLTHTEVDTNFTNLNTNKFETAAIPLGTLAAPSISFVGDANTGAYSPGADTLAFVTAGSNRVHITSGGLVGIGVSDPIEKLVVGGATANIGIYNSTIGSTASPSYSKLNFYGYLQTALFNVASISAGNSASNTYAGILQFATNTVGGTHTTALTIDDQQRVGIGTNSPLTKLEVRSGVITAGSVDSPSGAEILRGYYGSSGALVVIGSEYSSGGTVIGYAVKPSTSVDSAFLSSASGALPRGAYTIAGNIHKWYIGATQTVAENSSVSTSEVMRIDSSGRILVGTSSAASVGGVGAQHAFFHGTSSQWAATVQHTTGAGNSPFGLAIKYTAATPNNTSSDFVWCEDATAIRARIYSNGGLANYSANNANLSDRNAKKDISLAADTWNCVKEWEIVNYRYNNQSDDADLNLGVVAQQVAESCPEVITVFQEAKEATEDAPAQEERLGVKEQQMYWMAIKALQEAIARIETLEARLTAAGIE